MSWGAVAGAAISAVGGYMSSQQQAKSAAAGGRPPDTFTPLGVVDVQKKGKKIVANLSPEQQLLYNQMGGLAGQYLTPEQGYGGSLSRILGEDVGGMIPGLFSQYMGASQVPNEAMLQQYLGQLGGLQGQMGGMFGGTGIAGMNILGGAAPGSAQSNAMFGLGQQLTGQDYNDVFNQRLGLLREQAAPFEERAGNAFLNRQYAMGRMGSTGGSRDVEAFARGLSQADTTRQLDAMNLAEALRGRDMATGSNLMSSGLQGILSGFGQQVGGASNLLGLSGTLGNQLGGLYGTGFASQLGWNDLVNARAQQRMLNAQSLFGFGGDLNKSNLGLGTSLNTAQQNLVGSLMGNQGQAGGGGGAAGSPLGAGLMGFGNVLAANPGIFNFGGGGYNTGTPLMGPGGSGGTYNPTYTPPPIDVGPAPNYNFGG